MEEQDKLKLGIGTLKSEMKSLQPAKVKIVKVSIVNVEKAKSDKVQCEVKHPDKEDTIIISSVTYIDNKEIITNGLWFNLDKEDKIQKNSALAFFLKKLGVNTPEELEGKEVDTELDGKYLSFKAY